MHTQSNQEVIKAKKEVHQKSTAETASTPVRIRQKTKAKLELLLRQANKNRPGKKVKGDDLVLFALNLITEQHLAEICNKSLSNKDRLELLFLKLTKERRCSSRDEFFGLLLEGKVTI